MSQVKAEEATEMAKPMTIRQLARCTGVSIKTLREYERLGFLYTPGRSASNYRLFDTSALWCVQVIQGLRSLGLTLKGIRELTTIYRERPGELVGPHLRAKLLQTRIRVEAQIAELHALRRRIMDFESANATAQGQSSELIRLFASDLRRASAQSAS
jgi:DNA-binding transcriptional MerR regulator